MYWTINSLEKTGSIIITGGDVGLIGLEPYPYRLPTYDTLNEVVDLDDWSGWPDLGLPLAMVANFTYELGVQYVYIDQPTVAPAPNSYTFDLQLGWTAAAQGATLSATDDLFTFELSSSAVGAVVGVSMVGDGYRPGYADMLLSVGAFSGEFVIFVRGIAKTAPAAFSTTDTWQFIHGGDRVVLVRNGTPLWGVSFGDAVIADAALYAGFDTIFDAESGTGTIPAGTYTLDDPGLGTPTAGDGGGDVRITGYGDDSTPYGYIGPKLAHGGGEIAGVSVYGDELFAPSYAFGVAAITGPAARGYATDPIQLQNFWPVASIYGVGWAEADYADGGGAVASIDAIGFNYPLATYLIGSVPHFELSAVLRMSANELVGKVPDFHISARTGHQVTGKVPSMTIDAEITHSNAMSLQEAIGYA